MVHELMQTTGLTPSGNAFDFDGAGSRFTKFDGATPTKWFYREGAPIPKKGRLAVECCKEAVGGSG